MIMRQIDSKMTEAINHSILQLDDALFLNGSSYTRQLRSQASGFQSRVIHQLRDDLTRIATKTAQNREADGSISMVCEQVSLLLEHVVIRPLRI